MTQLGALDANGTASIQALLRAAMNITRGFTADDPYSLRRNAVAAVNAIQQAVSVCATVQATTTTSPSMTKVLTLAANASLLANSGMVDYVTASHARLQALIPAVVASVSASLGLNTVTGPATLIGEVVETGLATCVQCATDDLSAVSAEIAGLATHVSAAVQFVDALRSSTDDIQTLVTALSPAVSAVTNLTSAVRVVNVYAAAVLNTTSLAVLGQLVDDGLYAQGGPATAVGAAASTAAQLQSQYKLLLQQATTHLLSRRVCWLMLPALHQLSPSCTRSCNSSLRAVRLRSRTSLSSRDRWRLTLL